MIRISSGQFKGLSLVVPKHLRPTSAKVRQALGNILRDRLEGSRLLDGFAGSGALGIEALSRGAAFVAFLESDPEAVLAIRDNLCRLGSNLPRAAWRVVHLEVCRGLKILAEDEAPFDLVFLDPPYEGPEAKKALNAVVEYGILAPSGIIAVEHDWRTLLPTSVGPLKQWTQHRYGETVLSFYVNLA